MKSSKTPIKDRAKSILSSTTSIQIQHREQFKQELLPPVPWLQNQSDAVTQQSPLKPVNQDGLQESRPCGERLLQVEKAKGETVELENQIFNFSANSELKQKFVDQLKNGPTFAFKKKHTDRQEIQLINPALDSDDRESNGQHSQMKRLYQQLEQNQILEERIPDHELRDHSKFYTSLNQTDQLQPQNFEFQSNNMHFYEPVQAQPLAHYQVYKSTPLFLSDQVLGSDFEAQRQFRQQSPQNTDMPLVLENHNEKKGTQKEDQVFFQSALTSNHHQKSQLSSDQDEKVLVKMFEDFTSTLQHQNRKQPSLLPPPNFLNVRNLKPEIDKFHQMPQFLPNLLANNQFVQNNYSRRKSSITDLLNVNDSQFFNEIRDPGQDALSENSLDRKNLKSINDSKSIFDDQGILSDAQDLNMFHKFTGHASQFKRCQKMSPGRCLEQIVNQNQKQCTTNHYIINNLNVIGPQTQQRISPAKYQSQSQGANCIDQIIAKQRSNLFESEHEMSFKSDDLVDDNPLKFGCRPQMKPEQKQNDTTFSLPVIQDETHGMIRLKQGSNQLKNQLIDKKPKPSKVQVSGSQFSVKSKDSSRRHSVSMATDFAKPNKKKSEDPKTQLSKLATKNLFEGKPESVRKIILHKVIIHKRNGKTIKKPYKVVIRRSNKVLTKKLNQSTVQPSKADLQLRETKPKSNKTPLPSKSRLLEFEASQVQSQKSKHMYYNKSLGSSSNSWKKNESNQRESHIHHHHYYYFNQPPQIQTQNIDYSAEHKGKGVVHPEFDRQLQDSHYYCDSVGNSHSSRSKNDFNSQFIKRQYQNDRPTSSALKFEPKANFQEDSKGLKNFKSVQNLGGQPSSVLSCSVSENSLDRESQFRNQRSNTDQFYSQHIHCHAQDSNSSKFNQFQSNLEDSQTQRMKRFTSHTPLKNNLAQLSKYKDISLTKPQLKLNQFTTSSLSPTPCSFNVTDKPKMPLETRNKHEKRPEAPPSPIQFTVNPIKAILFEVHKVKDHHICPKQLSLEDMVLHSFHGNYHYQRIAPNKRVESDINQKNAPNADQVLNVERYLKVRRFFEKRQKRIWQKKPCYEVRQTVASKRLRIQGRFMSKEEQSQFLQQVEGAENHSVDTLVQELRLREQKEASSRKIKSESAKIMPIQMEKVEKRKVKGAKVTQILSIQAKRKLKQIQKKQVHPSSVNTKSKDGKQKIQKKEPVKK